MKKLVVVVAMFLVIIPVSSGATIVAAQEVQNNQPALPSGGDEHCSDDPNYIWITPKGAEGSYCADPSGIEDGMVYEVPTNVCLSGAVYAEVGRGAKLVLDCNSMDQGVYGPGDPLEEVAEGIAEPVEVEAEVSVENPNPAPATGCLTGMIIVDGLCIPDPAMQNAGLIENYIMDQVSITADAVNCRALPSLDAAVIATFSANDQVMRIAYQTHTDWQLVRSASGQSCYIWGELLGAVAPASSEVVPDEKTEVTEASMAGPTSTIAEDDRWGEVKSVTTLPATGIGVLAFQAQSVPADDDWNRELFLILVLASLVLVWVLAWPVMTRLIERSAEAKAVESGQWPHGEGEGTS